MFKIKALGSYFHTVTVDFPMGNGTSMTAAFDAEFKRLNQSEIEALNEDLREGRVSDRDVIDRVLVGWRNVGDADGNVLPFNPENLNYLLLQHPTKPTIVREFFASLEVAKAKN